jgi:hypothetical protein
MKPKREQASLFGDDPNVEGFALTSQEASRGRSQRGQGTQEGLPGVSRKVSVEQLTAMRERELAERARKKRRKNPERWLAPKLEPADRVRLKQLHDVYFEMFQEIQALPGAILTTRTGKYIAPEGYALLFTAGGVDHLFFQDAPPRETWSFVTVGRRKDEVEHLPNYLTVLERVDALAKEHMRRHNPSTQALIRRCLALP